MMRCLERRTCGFFLCLMVGGIFFSTGALANSTAANWYCIANGVYWRYGDPRVLGFSPRNFGVAREWVALSLEDAKELAVADCERELHLQANALHSEGGRGPNLRGGILRHCSIHSQEGDCLSDDKETLVELFRRKRFTGVESLEQDLKLATTLGARAKIIHTVRAMLYSTESFDPDYEESKLGFIARRKGAFARRNRADETYRCSETGREFGYEISKRWFASRRFCYQYALPSREGQNACSEASSRVPSTRVLTGSECGQLVQDECWRRLVRFCTR